MRKGICCLLVALLLAWVSPAAAFAEETPPILTEGNFDAAAYAARYADVAAVFGNDTRMLFLHYLVCGFAEGREGHATDAAVDAILNGKDYQAKLALYTASTAALGIAAAPGEELVAAAYYQNSLFIGDSITLAFAAYCRENVTPMTEGMRFMAQTGYSLHNELNRTRQRPVYAYESRDIFEAVQRHHPRRIFLALGINDLVYPSAESILGNYREWIARLKAAAPGASINIISVNYVRKEEAGALGAAPVSNEAVRALNLQLQQLALEYGVGYVDLAPQLADADGMLAPQYCSDGWLHQNDAAYAVWIQVLKEYAVGR